MPLFWPFSHDGNEVIVDYACMRQSLVNFKKYFNEFPTFSCLIQGIVASPHHIV